MRVLVTGASGFVGAYAVGALLDAGHDVVPVGGPSHRDGLPAVEIRDTAAVWNLVREAAPQAILHLAGLASVAAAMEEPLKAISINALGTANVLEAVRSLVMSGHGKVRLVYAGSAEVYGVQRNEGVPLDETEPVRPTNPYAASKLAAEAYALASAHSYGLDVIIARPFNHIGPGQDSRFVVPAFAKQLAEIAAGGPPRMLVGNLTAQRDFLDVRDVVAAYVALLANGRSGGVYNICSGRPVAIQEVLRQLITIARVPVEVREDPDRMRPSDTPVFYGDATKLRTETGWEPQYALAASLREVYADARERVAAVRA